MAANKDENPINFEASRRYAPLTGEYDVLTLLIKNIAQASLEGELNTHLNEDSKEDKGKNGHTKKMIRSGVRATLRIPGIKAAPLNRLLS